MNDDTRVTCERVDQDHLDTRYVRGTLDDPLAEAFEEHFFSCDRCWSLVHRGVAVRSAGAVPGATRRTGTATRWRPWLWAAPLAAAAAFAVWIGTRGPERDSDAPDATVRSAVDSLIVTAGSAAGVLRAAWAMTPQASSYRVRLFAADGSVLWDRRVADTVVMVARDSIPGGPAGPLYWQVQALDLAGSPVIRSPLVVVPPDSTP